MPDLEFVGHPVAFLVLYPSGGVCQTFPPGKNNEWAANQHAQRMKGLLVALPVLRDYRVIHEVTTFEKGAGQAPVNPPSINALDEPPLGKAIRITAGPRTGQLYAHRDHVTLPGCDGETWWVEHGFSWATWMQVQQMVGQAEWEVVDDAF